LLQRRHRGRAPPQMYADDAGGAGSDHLANGGWIQIMSSWTDVCEDRHNRLPMKRMRGSDKGIRGNNHLTLQVKRTNRNFQSDSTVAHRHAMADSQALRNSCL